MQRAVSKMATPGSAVPIISRDYWFKIVEFLQQNWALIDPNESGVIVWFLGGYVRRV